MDVGNEGHGMDVGNEGHGMDAGARSLTSGELPRGGTKECNRVRHADRKRAKSSSDLAKTSENVKQGVSWHGACDTDVGNGDNSTESGTERMLTYEQNSVAD
jgi:hypothetical protein